MLIKKLPTVVSPPKMSILWSTLWPYEPSSYVKSRKKETDEAKKQYKKEMDEGMGMSAFGQEPDFENARRIYYKGENLRVWPHEFSVMTPEKMKDYIIVGQSHILVECDYMDHISEGQEKKVKDLILDAITKPIYEAALIDGCNDNEARLVALGIDITTEEPDFPPISWYKIKPEYGNYYCTEQELEETDHRQEYDKQGIAY